MGILLREERSVGAIVGVRVGAGVEQGIKRRIMPGQCRQGKIR